MLLRQILSPILKKNCKVSKKFILLQIRIHTKKMSHDIYQQVPQRGDGAQDAENCRIAAVTDELERLCGVHEAQSGNGLQDVNSYEKEQRAAEEDCVERRVF